MKLYVLLTLSDKAFGRVGCEPGFAVRGLIRLLDKLKLTRDLPVIEEVQCLRLVLHVFHIFKVELKREAFVRQDGKILLHFIQMYPLNICIRLPA